MTKLFLKAVDTVLVKLYAQFGKTKDLLTLLQEPNDVSLLEVEPVLQETRQYNALCMLYKRLGDDLKLLESWAKYVFSEFNFVRLYTEQSFSD
jgi:hypothetical protein